MEALKIHQFPARLAKLLHRMDVEAIPFADGTATALSWYAAHVRGHRKQSRGERWEDSWSNRLKVLLEEDGWAVRQEVHFPDRPSSSEECDLVITSSDLAIWIEMKACWRCGADDQTNAVLSNSNFRNHIRRAAHDIDKLTPLLAGHATHVMLVVVGFDLVQKQAIDKESLKPVLEKTDGWILTRNEWIDPWRPKFRTTVWCWLKSAGTV